MWGRVLFQTTCARHVYFWQNHGTHRTDVHLKLARGDLFLIFAFQPHCNLELFCSLNFHAETNYDNYFWRRKQISKLSIGMRPALVQECHPQHATPSTPEDIYWKIL